MKCIRVQDTVYLSSVLFYKECGCTVIIMAIDTVNHEVLLSKLSNYGICDNQHSGLSHTWTTAFRDAQVMGRAQGAVVFLKALS